MLIHLTFRLPISRPSRLKCVGNSIRVDGDQRHRQLQRWLQNIPACIQTTVMFMTPCLLHVGCIPLSCPPYPCPRLCPHQHHLAPTCYLFVSAPASSTSPPCSQAGFSGAACSHPLAVVPTACCLPHSSIVVLSHRIRNSSVHWELVALLLTAPLRLKWLALCACWSVCILHVCNLRLSGTGQQCVTLPEVGLVA